MTSCKQTKKQVLWWFEHNLTSGHGKVEQTLHIWAGSWSNGPQTQNHRVSPSADPARYQTSNLCGHKQLRSALICLFLVLGNKLSSSYQATMSLQCRESTEDQQTNLEQSQSCRRSGQYRVSVRPPEPDLQLPRSFPPVPDWPMMTSSSGLRSHSKLTQRNDYKHTILLTFTFICKCSNQNCY